MKSVVKGFKIIAPAVFLLGIGYLALLIYADRELAQAYQALEKAGRPMKVEQVLPSAIPDSENGMLLYLKAIKRLKEEKWGEEEFLREFQIKSRLALNSPNGEVVTSEQWKELERMMAMPIFQEAISLIEQGASKRGFNLGVDYSKGATADMRGICDVLDLAKFLNFSTRIYSIRGDHRQAMKLAILNLRSSLALKNEPEFISYLVRMSQYRLAISSLLEAGQVAPPKLQETEQIQRLLGEMDLPTGWAFGMDGERLIVVEWMFRLLDEPGSPPRLTSFMMIDPIRSLNHSMTLNKISLLSELPCFSIADWYSSRNRERLERIPWYCWMSRFQIAGLSGCPAAYFKLQRLQRLAQVFIEVERCRQSNGVYPLEVPAETNQMDPFTGRPFAYRREGKGFVIEGLTRDQVAATGMVFREEEITQDGFKPWRIER